MLHLNQTARRAAISRCTLFTLIGVLLGGHAHAATHTIDTVLGGQIGDAGPAVQAQLQTPSDVTFDASGNLYIADNSANRIRKVATDGTISTVAGNGATAYGSSCQTGVDATLTTFTTP